MIEGGVFVPHWKSGETGEDLRAPKFRKGGVAVEEAASAALYPEPAESPVAEQWGNAARKAPPEILGAPEAEAAHRIIKGEAPPAEGVRSVVLACLIGVLIAALIIAGAFFLRPGSPEPGPETPATAPRADGAAG